MSKDLKGEVTKEITKDITKDITNEVSKEIADEVCKESILTLPNAITSVRLIGAVLLLFTAPFSLAFYIVYSVCGFTDLIDGTVARMTNGETRFGAKLDSIADLTFYTVMMIRILPRLIKILPLWVWYGIGLCVFLRIVTYTMAGIKFKSFASMHTYMNKISSGSMFFLPYILSTKFDVGYSKIVCIAFFIAAVEEFVMHLISKEYNPDVKTIFQLVGKKTA